MRTSLSLMSAAVALVAVSCGTAGPERFVDSETGVAFDYPGDWDVLEGLSAATEVGNSDVVSMTAVGALDSSSGNLVGVTVQVDVLDTELAPGEEQAFFENRFDAVMVDLAEASRGTLQPPGWRLVDGREARRYVIDAPVRGQDLRTDLTVLVERDVLYKVGCQAPVDRFDEEVGDGCGLVLESLAIP